MSYKSLFYLSVVVTLLLLAWNIIMMRGLTDANMELKNIKKKLEQVSVNGEEANTAIDKTDSTVQ